MTTVQLKEFKTRTAKYYKLIESLVKLNDWDQPEYTLTTVLLQNLAFDGVSCADYSHEEEVKSVNNKIESLRLIAEYNSHNWFTRMVYKEVSELNMVVTFER